MSFGSRMKELREYHGISRKVLAEKLGVSVPTISHYETDKTTPDLESLEMLMDYLGCDANYLLQDLVKVQPISFTTSIEEQELIKDFRKLDPILKGLISTEIKYLLSETRKNKDRTTDRAVEIPQLIRTAFPDEKRLFIVVGDSLEPLFQDGNILMVEPTDLLHVGDLGLFKYEGREIIRRYQTDQLEPINGNYDTIPFNRNSTKIIGKVISKI